jgi:phospholipid transport system substrate-binding protein
MPRFVPEELRWSPRQSNRGVLPCPGLRLRRFPVTSRGYWIVGSVLIALLLVCSAVVNAASQSSESPTEVVRATITEVFRILEDPKLKDPAMVTPRRRMLEEVIATRFDYTEMSKRALASHWAPLTAAQRDEFVELFKSFLSDRYANKIEGYNGQQVHYLSERIEGNYAEVRTEVRSSKVEIPMDYRLFLKETHWHAYDIVVDGISLVKNYRSQFEKIIRTDSYQELVRRLRDRTVTEERKGERS